MFGRRPSQRIEALIREERNESRAFMRELVKEREEFSRELTREREEFSHKLTEESRTFMHEILLRNEKVYTAAIREIEDMREQIQANTKAVLSVLDRLEGSGGAAA